MHVCMFFVVRNMALSAKDAINKFNVTLMEKLPLDNAIFFGMMREAKLFHLGADQSISQQTTRQMKVTFYLQNVFSIQPDEDLPKLLEVMKNSEVSGLVKLADQIKAEAEPGTYNYASYVHVYLHTYICVHVCMLRVCMYY